VLHFCAKQKAAMTKLFRDKKIIVAGGSSGIGLAAGRQFANLQAIVTVTGRNKEKLKKASDAGLSTAPVDSNDRAALDQFFKGYGKVDHLIISLSGSKGIGNFADLSLQTLREGFEEKFWPNLNTIQTALPYMSVGGSITLVTAISATAKLPGTSGLGAINGALEIMVGIWARELKSIRVNAISPGVVNTSWWDFLPAESKEATFAQYAQQIPVGRVATADEVADAILFVAGNTYMTGKIIGCDGGMS
jgi:NAD(P)-dependent dehydrogenase (short-subunit alcohol dehydrogenase family)